MLSAVGLVIEDCRELRAALDRAANGYDCIEPADPVHGQRNCADCAGFGRRNREHWEIL